MPNIQAISVTYSEVDQLSVGSLDSVIYQGLIKTLARGKKGAGRLTLEQSYQLVRGYELGYGTIAQLSAALMLMRVRGESADEVAGVVLAIADSIDTDWGTIGVTLDWPCYAGKRNQLPYLLLCAKVLAKQGHRILLHGDSRLSTQRYHIGSMLGEIGITQVSTPLDAKAALDTQGLCYVNADSLSPLADVFAGIHQQMGVRSLYQTAIRCVNPARANLCIRSYFHSGLDELHRQVAERLNHYLLPSTTLIFKGYQGESEINPRCETLLTITEPANTRQTTHRQITLPTALSMLVGKLPSQAQLCPFWLKVIEQNIEPHRDCNETKRAQYAIVTTLTAILLLQSSRLSVSEAVDKAGRLWRSYQYTQLNNPSQLSSQAGAGLMPDVNVREKINAKQQSSAYVEGKCGS